MEEEETIHFEIAKNQEHKLNNKKMKKNSLSNPVGDYMQNSRHKFLPKKKLNEWTLLLMILTVGDIPLVIGVLVDET